ncbi:CvpA family protein [Neisseria sp.]|uniref:CvpA family protein n=1 Tax=Neisseria sp. TaxID=192066 RepID=UPI0026DBE6CB|nr:CvpA family protein [Neisseria sp.]MDO4907563.1 CvpA family protein [Neisseria sp.]
MTTFDLLAFGLIGLCAIVSMMRGMIAEAASLITWIVAFVAAKTFAVPFSETAFSSFESRPLAVALSFIVLFAAAWLVQRFLRSLLTGAAKTVGLGGLNRLLGGAFGALKGVLLVTLAVIACSFTDLPQTDGWRQSLSAGYFESLAQFAVPYLPGAVADKIQYQPL